MTDGVAIPLHLAVHVLGVAVAAGLAALGWNRRDDVGPTWAGLVVGGGLVATAHILSGGLVVETATLPLVLRAAGYAGIAVGAMGTLASGAAVVLVAPLSVHLAAAAAGVAAAAASTRGRLREAGPVLLLGTGLTLWAAADGLGASLPSLAGAASVLGSIAVGSWIVVRVGSSLLARVLAGATALVVVTVLVLSSAGGIVFARDLESDQLESLQALTQAQGRSLGVDDPEFLRSLAAALAGSSLAAQLADPGEAGALDGRAQSLANLPRVDVALIVGAQGTAVGSFDVLAQVVGPLAPADETTLTGNVLVQQALSGVAGSGTIATADRRVLAVGVAPIAPIEADGTQRLDRIVGALVLGRSVSAASTMARVSEQTDADVIMLVSGRIAATTEPTLSTPEVNSEIIGLLAGAELPASAVLAGESRFVGMSSLGTVGQLLLVRDDAAGGDLEGDAARTLFWAALLGLALAAGLAYAAAQRIAGPVLQLTQAAERIAAGDEAVDLPAAGGDEVGRLSGAFTTMMSAVADRELDLAEAADTEADLRRRLEIMTSSLSEGLIAVDENGVVIQANPAAAKLLGVDDPVGRPITRVLSGKDDGGRSVIGALARSEGRVVKATVGKHHVAVAATSAPLLDARGRTLGRVHLLRDVTGEAQAERMKTEFLANISHELRTPLTPVRGYADVLARRELPHEQVASISGRIGDAAKRLERVIGMLVDYAALEAGRFDVAFAPTPLPVIIDNALAELRDDEVRDRVVIDVAEGLPHLDVDPTLFRRQLVELVDNGLKFSRDDVTITARRGPSRTIEVRVIDSGPGLDHDVLATLGEGFRQGDGSATRTHGGLGLGLAMVRRIADALSGEVRFETPPGGGTSVVLIVRSIVR